MPKALLPVLLIAAACVPVWAQENRSNEAILREIHGHHQGMAVWWMGNAGWLIKSGDLLIGSDLDLEANSKFIPKSIRRR
jgi:L-ascorbate 6-phosphate lactonase